MGSVIEFIKTVDPRAARLCVKAVIEVCRINIVDPLVKLSNGLERNCRLAILFLLRKNFPNVDFLIWHYT